MNIPNETHFAAIVERNFTHPGYDARDPDYDEKVTVYQPFKSREEMEDFVRQKTLARESNYRIVQVSPLNIQTEIVVNVR